MKTNKKDIRNMDQLEKEIYRLRLEARKKEDKFSSQLDFFRANFASITMNSFFSRSNKEKSNAGPKERFFSSIADKLADKAINGIENLLKRYFKDR
jgi:hypothetical protein